MIRNGVHAFILVAICLVVVILYLPVSEAQNTPLREQKAELYVQTGHAESVSSVAFSPDGKILASGSYDKTIKLWSVETGAELRTLRGETDAIQSVAFSPDGKTLASGNFEKTIKLWSVETGAELRTLRGHTNIVNSVVFSPDGKILASGSHDGTIKLWSVETGAELRTLREHTSSVHAVYSVAFSPDGKTLAESYGETIKLWNVETGQEIRTLSGHTALVDSVAFSPDGKTIASSGGADNTIRLWNVETGAELRTLHGHTNNVQSVAFSPDGKTLASGSYDKTIKLWSVETGAELRTLRGHTGGIRSVAFLSDGKTLASGSYDNTIKLWSVETRAELRTFRGHTSSIIVYPGVFSPNGKTLASGRKDNTIKLWSFETGAELRTLRGHLSNPILVIFSPDGKILASSDSKTIKLWSVETGHELSSLKGLGNIAFSPDSKILASASDDNTIKLWSVETGVELRTLRGHTSIVHSVAFSPDGKTLASGSYDNTIKLWSVEAAILSGTGQELRTLSGHTGFINSVAFSPDGKTVASWSFDGTIKLWNVESGELIKSFPFLTALAAENRSLIPDTLGAKWTPTRDKRFLIKEGQNGRLDLYDNNSRKLLASLIALDENDWAVVTPDGLFDGSPNSWKLLSWRMSEQLYDIAPVEAFFNEFYRPNLLQDIFAGRTIERPKRDISTIDIRQPEVKVKLSGTNQNTANITQRQVTVSVEVTDAPADSRRRTTSGAKDVRLFRNGSLVKIWRGDVLKGKSNVTLTATVPIVARDNNFTAYAFNNDNVKSRDAELLVQGADSLRHKGTAYILAIGVNNYANSQYNLKYAMADAQDFAEVVKQQQAKLGQYERIEVISLNNKDATKANILKSLVDLSTKIQPEDAVIIYFAGHGTAQGNRFYLIPHDLGYSGSRTQLDAAGLQSILSHSISDEELEKAVEGIDAGQMLLVIDACNSGQALEAEEKRRGPMNSKGLAQLAYEKGMYILTAAQSYQAALEASKLGHGYLTYALVEEGLKNGAADTEPKDSQVLLREWLDYATNRVPQMQQEKMAQGRQLQQEDVTFVQGEENIKDPTKRSLQRPRVFYRRETEPQPFVVARP
jgi:WD40 repeat protein